MTALPSLPSLLSLWRLDEQRHAAQWDSGEGARLYGGRWNPPGIRAVYCATDPATAILEVAVHKGFAAFVHVPHTLTSAAIGDTSHVTIIRPEDVPDPRWLRPGLPSPAQQAFGAALLARHRFVMIPSAVSPRSWNLVFDPGAARGHYRLAFQEPFELDSRLLPGA